MNFAETSGKIIDGRIEFTVPLTKVDTERRMVHGFATLDNIDLAGDIVPIEASLKAFKSFAGNMREMHDRLKAVGSVISFKPERFYDPKTDKVYNGIFVSAYVSKGAEDTWQKVLDGTLRGFSIGGVVTKTSDKIVDKGIYRVIEDYFLNELSLVDNPCNQLSAIMSFEKSADGGYLANTSPENVFWCRNDNTVQITSATATTCYHCDTTMQNIGFVESSDSDKMEVVKSLLAGARYVPSDGDTVDFNEGIGVIEKVISAGTVKLDTSDEVFNASETDPVAIVRIYAQNDDTMVAANRRILKNVSSLSKTKDKEVENVNNAETDVTVVEEVVIEKSVDESLGAPQVFEGTPKDAAEETVVEEVAVEEVVEPVEEVAAEEVVVEKAVEAPVDDNSEMKALLKSLTDALAPLAGLAELVKSLGGTVQENSEAIQKVSSDLSAAKDEIASATTEFGKRVDAVESKSAFQKSADLGEIRQVESVVPAKQSKWAGRILDTAYFNN